MTLTGWATVPGDDECWHAFAATEGTESQVTSRCGVAELSAACLADLERVPRGRPCVTCLLTVTAKLPPVGRMGSAS